MPAETSLEVKLQLLRFIDDAEIRTKDAEQYAKWRQRRACRAAKAKTRQSEALAAAARAEARKAIMQRGVGLRWGRGFICTTASSSEADQQSSPSVPISSQAERWAPECVLRGRREDFSNRPLATEGALKAERQWRYWRA